MNIQDERERLAMAHAAVRQGNTAEARRLISSVLKDNPRNVVAWSLACKIATHREEQIYCLQQILAIDPTHTAARRYLAQLQATTANSGTPARPSASQAVTEDTPPEKNRASRLVADVLLMPLGCLLQASATYLIVGILALVIGGAIIYYTTNTSFLGLAAPDFDQLTISASYRQIKADDLSWEITFEEKGDSRFAGLVRHVSPIRNGNLLILTHDVLVTSGDYADPTLVRTSVFNHRFTWRSSSTANPNGTINLLHTVPANQEIYRQLLQIRRQDEVVITGREILNIEVYDSQGNYMGDWHDTGCNTLLVNSVTIVPK